MTLRAVDAESDRMVIQHHPMMMTSSQPRSFTTSAYDASRSRDQYALEPQHMCLAPVLCSDAHNINASTEWVLDALIIVFAIFGGC